MRKKLFSIIVILVAFCHLQVAAQSSRVTGKVTGPDGNPIAGASVTISGTNQGTVTDNDGNFAIVVPNDASLLVNSIGFTDQVIKVDGRSNLNVALVSGQSAGLEEVVVTGYTAQKKKDIVGSVAVVDVKALKSVPSGSAMSALQGQAAGVNVVNNGSPGAASQILIRGVTGFANNPLVLIDGVQGNINDVPATDVESIQVLKDAGAASIYGARGGNGVIVITTKKGKSGAPSVVYDSYYNLQIPRSIDKLDLITAQQYADIYASINPTTQLFPGGVIPDFAYRGPNVRGVANAGDPAVDPAKYNLSPLNASSNYLIAELVKNGSGGFYDAIMNPALMMQHNVTASGGTDRANYLLSLGYLDHEGTLENTLLRRYNVRVNTQFKVRENIRLGQNLNIYYKNNPNGGGNVSTNGGFGPIQASIVTPPFIPIYDIMGNYAGPFVGPTDELGDWGNPKATVDLVSNNRRREYGMQGNVYLEIDFLKNFTARTSFGGTIDNYYTQRYTPRQYWSRNGASNDNLRENSGFYTTAQWTNTLNYRNQFGRHNLSVLVGSESVENKYRNQEAIGENFFLNTYEYLILGNAATRQLPTGDAGVGPALFSLFGKVDYAFNDKYLVGITVRRDGFSEFGANKKYGTFPAVAVGWRLSEESFMQNVTWINELKIRASYGEMGNKEGVPVGNAFSTYAQNPFYSYYDIRGTGNSLAQGFYPRRYGNANTSWETNKLTNIGFDANLFNNKLDLSVEYYKKATDGLLRVLPLASTAGEGASPYVNIGDIQNQGIDVVATYRARITRDFNISIGANFTSYKNEIKKMPDPGYYDEGQHRFEAGHPMSSFFGYKVLGVFRDQKDVDDSPTQQDAAPGRWKYLDADGNGVINSLDRVHYADPNPDFTLGLNLGATYKNFDFSAILYTAQGQSIYNGLMEFIGSWERGVGNAKSSRVLNAWSETNPNGTWKKAEQLRNFSNSSDNTSAFIEKGSYTRLRNVQLGYTLQSNSLKRIGFSRLRVYVGATNLFVITNYSGLDPEVSESGVAFRGTDAGAYSPDKGVVLGLNVSF